MSSKKYFPLFFVVLVLSLTSCATTYNSLKSGKDGNMQIIAASHSEILSAAYEAISSEFPSANINEITGYQSGFSWFHMPLLDRTDFKFLVKRVTGKTNDGSEIEGYTITITTSGTQGFVEARYVQPVVKKFEATLLERGIKKLVIAKVTYSSNSGSASKFGNKSVSTGTGFFISESGYLITNYHVIKNANTISIIIANGKTIPVDVVLKDEINDIALLKAGIRSKGLKISSSNTVNKGEEVFTLGYPLIGLQGQEQKATFGRVNALSGVKGDIRYFQVDIPIQPGNSGGPLIDKNGHVVGLITAMLSQLNTLRKTGVLPQNVNYAVKSDYLIPLLAAKGIHQKNIVQHDQDIDFDELIKSTENSVVLVIAN